MIKNPLRGLIHPQGVGRGVPGCYAASPPLAALRVIRFITYPYDMSRSLRPAHLALKPLMAITKCFLVLMLPGLLAACGSALVPRQPLAIEQARAADKDARKALRDGELLRAQHDFAKALELQQSLDDVAGAATTLINLATVTHQLHDDEGALTWLNKMLLEKKHIYPRDSQLAAAFRKAVILANLGRLSDAESTLQFAEKLCEKKCAQSFSIDVLHARLLLLNGDADGALALAQAVGKEGVAGKEEQANAMRVAAAAEEKLARSASALQHFQAALEMDKALGLSERIGEDLSGMARVSTRLGRDHEAAEYARRADLVKEARRQSESAP
jgi:tetratricopeptide (TPR) repeat protein